MTDTECDKLREDVRALVEFGKRVRLAWVKYALAEDLTHKSSHEMNMAVLRLMEIIDEIEARND